MIKNKQKTSLVPIEKVLLFAGLALIVVGCIANLYSTYINMRFINDPIDSLYYLRYIVLLGGGFLAGYLLTRASTNRRFFNGATYAILAAALYLLLDQLRMFPSDLTADLAYPWGKVVFFGMPLVGLMITLAFAAVSRLRMNSPAIGTVTQWTLIVAFVMYQAILLFTIVDASNLISSLWFILASPLVVAGLTYILLKKLPSRLSRLFYSAFIGTFYYMFVMVLWEFRTNSSAEATNLFSAIALIATLIFTALLVWHTRKAIK